MREGSSRRARRCSPLRHDACDHSVRSGTGAAFSKGVPARMPLDPDPGLLVGRSSGMDHVREAVAMFSAHPGPLLVRGEPGTGKSLVASLLGSTSAVIIMEEVGDASLDIQQSLVELARTRGTAVRVIATTSRDIERFARAGSFLPEFLELLGGPAIWLPPLRTRRSDIPELARHFLDSLPGRELDQDALRLLERQSWPGNVRQLRAVIRRLALLHDRITVHHVERELRTMRAESG
jgi:DNA-binding NtrC family response regulator